MGASGALFERRHYRVLAEVLYREAEEARERDAERARIGSLYSGEAESIIKAAAAVIADALAADNPRFDRERFYGWALRGKRDNIGGGWA